ncbi:MAG: hypothetical protein K6356_11590 [Chloroflexus sp.]
MQRGSFVSAQELSHFGENALFVTLEGNSDTINFFTSEAVRNHVLSDKENLFELFDDFEAPLVIINSNTTPYYRYIVAEPYDRARIPAFFRNSMPKLRKIVFFSSKMEELGSYILESKYALHTAMLMFLSEVPIPETIPPQECVINLSIGMHTGPTIEEVSAARIETVKQNNLIVIKPNNTPTTMLVLLNKQQQPFFAFMMQSTEFVQFLEQFIKKYVIFELLEGE